MPRGDLLARVHGSTTPPASGPPSLEVLDDLALLPLDIALLYEATSLRPTRLRSLDALHLAST